MPEYAEQDELTGKQSLYCPLPRMYQVILIYLFSRLSA